MRSFKYPIYFLIVTLLPCLVYGGDILLQSTTSTNNSGFYDHILPKFKNATGISVKVVAVGTGQAITNAENCDADILIVHAKEAEEDFVAGGGGIKRHDLMYNDFVIVGPGNYTENIVSENKSGIIIFCSSLEFELDQFSENVQKDLVISETNSFYQEISSLFRDSNWWSTATVTDACKYYLNCARNNISYFI